MVIVGWNVDDEWVSVHGFVFLFVRRDGQFRLDRSLRHPEAVRAGGRDALLAKVWDGSRSRVGDNLGYNLCFATATPSMSRRIVPLHMTMWSAKEEGFTSENDKVLDVVRKISGAVDKRGIYVYDRGGDGDWLFDFFVEEGLDFIVRPVPAEACGRSWRGISPAGAWRRRYAS